MSGRKRKLSTYRSKTKIKKLAADRKDKKRKLQLFQGIREYPVPVLMNM